MNSTVSLNHRIFVPPVPAVRRRCGRNPAGERAYRRALRAAELAAWNAADPQAITQLPTAPKPTERTEAFFYLLLAGAVIVALIFGAHGALEWVANSEPLESLLRSLLS